jgi:hypothetical protein
MQDWFFDVFTAVTMKNAFFWDRTPCGSCKNRLSRMKRTTDGEKSLLQRRLHRCVCPRCEMRGFGKLFTLKMEAIYSSEIPSCLSVVRGSLLRPSWGTPSQRTMRTQESFHLEDGSDATPKRRLLQEPHDVISQKAKFFNLKHSFHTKEHYTTLLSVQKTWGTHRPGEVKGESDRVGEAIVLRRPNQTNAVFAQNWSDNVPVCARWRRIDLGLVVLQTNPEPCSTRSRACSGARGPRATAALTYTVLPIVVDEGFQPELEHSGAAHLQQ